VARKRKVIAALVIALSILLIALGGVVTKSEHAVFWLFQSEASYKTIPITTMPVRDTPEDWVKCDFGSISFCLPPEYVNDPPKVLSTAIAIFSHGDSTIAVFHPHRTKGPSLIEIKEWNTLLDDRHGNAVRLQIDAWKAMPSDFRWGMSKSEVRKLNALLHFKTFGLGLSRSAIDGEEYSDAKITGLLTQSASDTGYDWYCSNHECIASIMFEKKSGGMDIDVTRIVAASVRCENELVELPKSQEEVLKLLRIRKNK
jgi:hypothetical protein